MVLPIVVEDASDMSESKIKELSRRIKDLEQENRLLAQAVTQLQISERNLLEILHNTPAPIYLKDSDGRYLLVNRQYEILSHVTLKELIGKNDHDIYPEPIATLFRSQDEEVKRQNTSLEFEETIPLPDGEYTFITYKFPVHDADGNITAVGGFCTDITERGKIEKVKAKLIVKLQKALDEVKTLRGIIPICAFCKKIRDDKGYWTQVETYVSQHTGADFSHSCCPECIKQNYPEISMKLKKTSKAVPE
jgi:PAS domain S-box-containing protein